MKIQRKHGYKKAVIAVARKLAIIMYRMMITRKEFIHGEPKKPKERAVAAHLRMKSKKEELLTLSANG